MFSKAGIAPLKKLFFTAKHSCEIRYSWVRLGLKPWSLISFSLFWLRISIRFVCYDSLSTWLKGPHVFKSRIREKIWQPTSNRFEVIANTNEGSIYTIAEETVDKSYTVKASEFDIDIRKVTVDLEKFSPFFNECRKKQDIMKQNMMKDV